MNQIHIIKKCFNLIKLNKFKKNSLESLWNKNLDRLIILINKKIRKSSKIRIKDF